MCLWPFRCCTSRCEGWKHPPFSAYEEDGVIYSRRFLDNISYFFQRFLCLYCFKETWHVPEREVRIIFGCDEELI